MGSPWERYQQDLKREGFAHDPSQEQAVKALQQVFDGLVARHQKEQGLMGRLGASMGRKPRKVKGLYFWGGVGRGKTYLMDTFYDAIPFSEKKRLHFHHFMRLVHEQLKVHKGKANPLDLVARELAQDTRVLCFDEFFVSDIGDAMILGNLLETLFEEGVTLVTTSNIVPDQLYKDGLQRKLFLPAIETLKRHTDVLNVDGGVDYRLRTLKQVEIFHSPLDKDAEENLTKSFRQLAPDADEALENEPLDILGRQIVSRWVCDDVALFDFSALCEGPRSQNDYIEIAQRFHAVLISGVPEFIGKNDDAARRFINLVDEFYDRNVKLLMTAAKPVDSLYKEGKLSFEFQRTVSRLLEMQSEEYLELAHKS
ncbi:cell division protein ZapE [Reinekea blandensis]|uniref:Cell division protein ZapE n=1 Tax=Reinekea blandensis MED297 TaxID=314283 RepID=A4BC96_9GAMM|nr:cell division protein ZapE [Reinekea blandensis]EAR10162.1 ATPase, putative [Reinekea sp. MED297] [Reinekea blandensis MED297]